MCYIVNILIWQLNAFYLLLVVTFPTCVILTFKEDTKASWKSLPVTFFKGSKLKVDRLKFNYYAGANDESSFCTVLLKITTVLFKNYLINIICKSYIIFKFFICLWCYAI